MKFDVVIIGGGLAGLTAGVELCRVGVGCAAVAEGLSIHNAPMKEYVDAGGVLLSGDSVVRGEWEGNRLLRVFTRNLENTPLEAGNFIISTGKFFSLGLRSDMNRIYEPVFDCDVLYDADRENWVNPDFWGVQPFETFGVRTDAEGRVYVKGVPSVNLYAAGEILAGKVDIVKSALEVCRKLK